MKTVIYLFFLLFNSITVLSQGGFEFRKSVDRTTIPFQLINNLIFIPVQVNGVELTFLLDSGVEETLVFSLEDKQEIKFSNVEKITLRGLGSEDAIEGLKSTTNVLEIAGIRANDQLLYIILDQVFNLSSHVGIPVNGIIGYQFFKNNLVEINYEKKRIIVHRTTERNRKKIEGKFEKEAITIERFKPYIIGNVEIDSAAFPAKLLIDIGNSDPLWLFENRSKLIKIPAKNFEDYLGHGFSGDIEGRRAKILKFQIAKFEFRDPIAAFPDSSSVRNVKMVPGRVGSVGGEILRRFAIVFDYDNGFLYLRKNKEYDSAFHYNKSGVEIQQPGLQWIQEAVALTMVPSVTVDDPFKPNASNFKYKFKLKPIYEIANIRKNSPAANSGLQVGDVLVAINKNEAYKYSLQEINSLFKSDEEKWLSLEIKRNGQLLTFRFQLQNLL